MQHLEWGSGAPLVCLHAAPLDGKVWAQLARRVIAPDLRGFVTMAQAADAAAQLLDQLGVIAAPVMGVSMGGEVALALAERHPARVAGLVLFRLRDRPAATDLLRRLRLPILLIAGADDSLAPAYEMQKLAATIAGAELAVVEQPDLCALVAEFIDHHSL